MMQRAVRWFGVAVLGLGLTTLGLTVAGCEVDDDGEGEETPANGDENGEPDTPLFDPGCQAYFDCCVERTMENPFGADFTREDAEQDCLEGILNSSDDGGLNNDPAACQQQASNLQCE